MVKELLTSEKINLVKSVTDWRDAVVLAAQPLLCDGSITQDYVDGMLRNIEKNGPYVVLADRFALPHAGGEGCVNRVALSLLQVEETVDLLGKPVNVFLVLATPDNRSHIEALAQLMDLLYDPQNLALLATGTREQLLEMISAI